ncbi:metallophosphoesterase family protein [Halovenus sp. HT40]|uniref:metallophosphoesterase family protein n=1 Tax=Halovenus sp. HT40 TaxID=3126691 RepID=UPI00300F2274
MEIAIISDTHIPSRAQAIPEPFRERITAVDHVIHAGDFDSKGALADIQDLAPELTAVAGNMDPHVGLPDVTTVELGGVEFVVTHGTGSPRGYEQRVADAVREHADSESAVGVAGHTHELLDTARDGIRLLNPGSVTAASPASEATMMAATAETGELSVTVHEA